ncbi:MAG: DNA/RNA non-specific endonuclease [Clostridia bacterium]|nr:DNA/RNA non-specific endonuclease [Clostridia bacterium]
MSRRRVKNKIKKVIIGVAIIILISICEYINLELQESRKKENTQDINQNKFGITIDLSDIPDFTNEPYVIINNNIPSFNPKDYATESFEQYSQLDILGRCGVAYANISRATMPPDGQERENISFIHPSGWRQKRYNGEYLYNRCHLIGYQLSSENANELNLITGTRYMNVEGMLPFENQVAEYINEKEDENRHVLYRVTPIFEGDNLIASGVQMEAYSMEDNGEGVCFNVYVYNVQPGVNIDYETGRSWIEK